jgi:phage protein D
MPISPLVNSNGLVCLRILCGDSAIPDTVHVLSAEIRKDVNQVPTATLTLLDGDLIKGGFPLSDMALFQPGTAVAVQAGYDGNETRIFAGRIVRHGIVFVNGKSHLKLECQDAAIAMTAGRKHATYVDKKDSDIISALVGSHAGLSADVEATAVDQGERVQYDCTDWDFMLARAKANGLWVMIEAGKVTVAKPAAKGNPVLALTYGMDMLEFQADMDTRIQGRVRFQGSALAMLGSELELRGVGARFQRPVLAAGVSHDIRDGNWTTEVRFETEPQRLTEGHQVAAPFATARTAGIAGLHVGLVLKRDGDPESQGRIQVCLPPMGAATEGVWARMGHLYGSDGCGVFFLPETGDEVILGFFDNDPSHPVILGSLYGGKRKPPREPTAENYLKAIVTKGGLAIEFDDGKKSLTLSTPGKNTVVLDDEGKTILIRDQTGNSVTLSETGIEMASLKDISIKAMGKITLEAKGAMQIKAAADVKVEGLNVDINAWMGFAGKGAAAAELSSGGQTTVKGAMVMIN